VLLFPILSCARVKYEAHCVRYQSLSVCQVWTRSVNACPRNGWEHVQHRVCTTKMATSQTSLIKSWNKMMCLCIPSCIVFVPSLNKIGPYMSEIWLHMDGYIERWDPIHQPRFGPSPTGVTNKKNREHGGKMFVVFSGMKHVIIPSGKTWEACWQPVPTKTIKILLAPQGRDSVWEKQQQQQSKITYFTEMIKITEVRGGSEWTSVNLYRFLLEKLWVNPQWSQVHSSSRVEKCK